MDVKFFEGFPNVFDSLDGEFGGVAGLKNHIFSLMCFLNTLVQIQGQGTQNYVLVHFLIV